MEKEIFIKKIIQEDDMGFRKEIHRGRRDGMHMNEGRRGNSGLRFGSDNRDKGRGNHLNGGRRDSHGPHQEEGCYKGEKKSQSFRGFNYQNKAITKMFTSKKDLVEYVNSIGDLGNKIDIYKIEDDLYKVVVIERYQKEVKETL